MLAWIFGDCCNGNPLWTIDVERCVLLWNGLFALCLFYCLENGKELRMIDMNEKMKKLIRGGGERGNPEDVGQIVRQIVSKSKLIRDCVVFDNEGNLKEDRIYFEHMIMKFAGDWTGIEVYYNELRYEKTELPYNQYLNLVVKLAGALEKKYDRKMVVYLSDTNNGFIDLRYHSYREYEGLWLRENLDEYDNPILCWK